MIILKRVFKFITVLLLLTNLSGCNTIGLKDTEDAPEIDLLALRDEADSAYLNDDLKTSEENYTILVKEMPEEALHWYRLANIYVRTNRPDAAINLYREAVIRDPEFSKAWYNLGIVQLKQTVFSLNEMLIYTDRNDPLYSKAATILEEIKDIIRE
ncbi:MAG: tetratricopeptide repeat protein [Gammaproteobacteria bacterium]|nr:tetratricopeptide repeat protein [Gammaproteobacteria bacterium]